MHNLQVGNRYDPSGSSYPQTEQVRFTPEFSELARFWPSPSQSEVDSHRDDGEFAAVLVSEHLLMFAYRFGSLDWSDVPFQIGRLRDADLRGVPEGRLEDPIHLRTLLVDSDTGIIRAMRRDTLSSEVSAIIRGSLQMQLDAPFDDDTAGRHLSTIYEHFSTSEAMVREAAQARCAASRPSTVISETHYG